MLVKRPIIFAMALAGLPACATKPPIDLNTAADPPACQYWLGERQKLEARPAASTTPSTGSTAADGVGMIVTGVQGAMAGIYGIKVENQISNTIALTGS